MATGNGTWASAVGKAITAVDRPGAFCTSGTAQATLPGLDVPGLGMVGLPLSPGQADQLKRQCDRAAYGKGERTVVDPDVRRVWRLPPDRFALANPAWAAGVTGIVEAVSRDLGLDGQVLQPHLYDLLLYEPGGFFLPHRDGQKLDRMVATLVVVLPSHYTGGELVVRHEGQERTIDLGGEPSRFQTQYAAFYADCEHEVKPVTAGHRLCLVYNLTLGKATATVGAPRRDRHVRGITDLLGRWPTDGDAPAKLAVTLEHQYTKGGLAWDALKGIDRARADVLAAAAAGVGCHAYLALVTLWECGSSEGDGYDDYHSYGRRADDEDDDGDSSDDEHGGKYEMDELIDESLTADDWRGPDGTPVPFGPLPVAEGEVWPPGSLRTVKPDEKFEGYTGNAGMTLDRWYRRAAVVLWPDAHHFDVLCEAGAKQAVAALLQLTEAARLAMGAAAAVLRDRCRRFAAAVLAAWPPSVPQYWGRDVPASVDPLPCLDVVDDVPLVRTYLRDTLQKDAQLRPGPELVGILSRHGWPTFRPDLAALFERTTGQSLDRNVGLLDLLCRAATRLKGKADRAAATDVCRDLAGLAVDALIAIDGDRNDRPVGDVAARVARLARSLLRTDDDDRLSRLVAHVIATPDRYPLQAVQMASLTRLAPSLAKRPKRRLPALDGWIADVRRRLESLTAAVPQPPADRRRDAAVACTSADCAELNRFLADPVERQHPFKMAQARRDHLENQINRFRCDLDRETDRRSRPQILICTKNDATYRRLLDEYHQNLVHLAAVKALEPTA